MATPDQQQHVPHRQPPPPPIRSTPPPRPPPPRLSRSATQGILDQPSTSAGLNRSTEAIPAYTEVMMRRNRPNQNTGGPTQQPNRERSKFRRTQSLRVPKKRQRRPQITIVSSRPMSEHPAFADGLKGGYVPPEAPPSYDEVLKQRRRESFTLDGELPKVTSDDAFMDRLTYRDIEIYSSSSPSPPPSSSSNRQQSTSNRASIARVEAPTATSPPPASSSYSTTSESESPPSSQEMSVELQSACSDAVSTTTTSNGATDAATAAPCRASISSTSDSDQSRKTPIKPPRRKSNASAPRRPAVLPPKPVAAAVSNVDIDEASGYATLNFSQAEPEQNGKSATEEPSAEPTVVEEAPQPQATEDTTEQEQTQTIPDEAIYAKVNKKPMRKPPPKPRAKPRDPPPPPSSTVEASDDQPPPLPATRPPPEVESPKKPVPKPRRRTLVEAPDISIEDTNEDVAVSFADDAVAAGDTDESLQQRSNSNAMPQPPPHPSPAENRRLSQPFVPNEETAAESTPAEPASKDKKSKMGVLRSKSLRWTKGKLKNLKKDSSKNGDGPRQPVVTTSPQQQPSADKRRSISTTTALRKPPSSPAHRTPPSRPGRPSLPAVLSVAPEAPSARRVPPPRPKPPARPPPPKISSIDNVKIKPSAYPTKVEDIEKHREKVVDEKMKSYMASQGYYVAVCNHSDFSDLTFCTGDRIFVMYAITDELVFGRNEDGEEGPFPLSCVRPEDEGSSSSMNENNQSNVNVRSCQASSSSRWSSSSDGLSLNVQRSSPQRKPSPSKRVREPPARPTRPPVPSTPEKTFLTAPLLVQEETHSPSLQPQPTGGAAADAAPEKQNGDNIDAIRTNGSSAEESKSPGDVVDNTTDRQPQTELDNTVTNGDCASEDMQSLTIKESPKSTSPSSSSISSAIVCENNAVPAKAPPRAEEAAAAPASFNVIALYTYDTGVDGDLNFQSGDVLRVTRTVDELWFEGSCARDAYTKVGIFPQVYVKSIQEGLVNIYDLFPALARARRRR